MYVHMKSELFTCCQKKAEYTLNVGEKFLIGV